MSDWTWRQSLQVNNTKVAKQQLELVGKVNARRILCQQAHKHAKHHPATIANLVLRQPTKHSAKEPVRLGEGRGHEVSGLMAHSSFACDCVRKVGRWAQTVGGRQPTKGWVGRGWNSAAAGLQHMPHRAPPCATHCDFCTAAASCCSWKYLRISFARIRCHSTVTSLQMGEMGGEGGEASAIGLTSA